MGKKRTKLTKGSFKLYKRLLAYAFKHWPALLVGLTATMAAAATDAGVTWFLKPLLDKGFVARDIQFLSWLPIIIMGTFIVRGTSAFISDYYMTWIGRQVVMRLRQDMFKKLIHLPATFFDKSSSGQLLSAILYNVEQVAKASTDAIVTIVQQSCLIIGLLSVIFMNSWKLGLIFFATAPFIALNVKVAGTRMRKISKKIQNIMGGVTHVAEEAIEGYKVVRTFGTEDYEIAKFNKVTNKNRAHEMKVVVTKSMTSSTVQFFAGGAIAFIIYIATSGQGGVTAGGFASLLGAMLGILKPMKSITNVSGTINKGLAAAESIFNIIDEPPEVDQGTQMMERSRGEVEFRSVDFQYDTSARPVLQGIDLKAEAGKTIALVGRSGSGKTTLVNLLPRFYQNYSGQILIDGIDTREIKLSDLRR